MSLVLQAIFLLCVAFSVVKAVEAAARLLTRKRNRKRDVERPPSPIVKPLSGEKSVPSQVALRDKPNDVESASLQEHKDLYYKLQNLERYPEILPRCRDILIQMFAETLTDAQEHPETGILSIECYTRENLAAFLRSENDGTTEQWEQYVARRKGGSVREMFKDKEEAVWWLKQAAPVKYVDGAWLGHINKISTPFALRRSTKDAWQVMSEELGDGDLDKNHVTVYRDLMEEIGAGLPEGDTLDFIHPRHDLNEPRVWKAALAQLLISLFPHEFLPEILGFNMAYEGLPLHLMKTVKELEELKLNAYYFLLHIAIDNADSGHARMAMEAAVGYIEQMREKGGDAAAQQAWKRVQAGFVLAEGLPTTPQSPSLKLPAVESFPRNDREAEVVKIFQAKAPVAHKIHCSSRLKIGRHSLVDWLEPNAFASKQWQMDFLDDLSSMKPWVRKGDSSNSRLIQELSWEGKMFGSFTQSEVEVVKAWIDGLGAPDSRIYWSFVGRDAVPSSEACQMNDIREDYPVLKQVQSSEVSSEPVPQETLTATDLFSPNPTNINRFIPLWFAHPCLLENFVSIPAKVANSTGSAVVRVLRAQSGFENEGPGVAGMDEVRRPHTVGLVELGLEMMQRAGLSAPRSLKEALAGRDDSFAIEMLHASMKPIQSANFLIGMAWAFVQLHEALTASSLLSETSQEVLRQIARRERDGLRACLEVIEQDTRQYTDFSRGYSLGRAEIEFCFTRS
ncbi:hypothetical protein W97_03661 [Coniosporium apollinis CBS 100218]|uniref:Uncharacterized protein n=1 Tax=Coniosporium apollinis (strain CBS 100218) TaxID=1168221 RepID=R7YR80_CONA1|nr:uncharacterized protein W97_03661 [Coniosporium apollinis CBS 100218]EON64430.1 hypothetical protein W97_03661 [Coniosporium apollinis CBS 100218]